MAGSSAATADQLALVRLNLGALQAAFTDANIQLFWASLATNAPNQTLQYRACVALCYETALAQLVNYHDFTTGNTSDKYHQVFDNAFRMYETFKPALERIMNARTDIAIASMRSGKAAPVEPVDNGTNSYFNLDLSQVFP